ncbi:NMCC_0638 family (lipo)protein [Marinomonas transparens]|uniref:Uncharacterized protein n=1 Tax=Marinomonas transparens TaxID=2795388 RepID=A0A934N498_9GAMM|nr:hypothetical protein [Marinomonas transparens]MBJ7539843.1 hypothetical protein [Marinomonas transparens]
MRRRIIVKQVIFFFLCSLTFEPVIASTDEEHKASIFIKYYTAFCLSYVTNLESLRESLTANTAKLPPKVARKFLSGHDGDAWKLLDEQVISVVALPNHKKFCSLSMQKADTEYAKKQFIRLVSTAPQPFMSKQVSSHKTLSALNVLTNTISYEWSLPNSRQKMLFTLKTALSPKADVQLFGSTEIVQ